MLMIVCTVCRSPKFVSKEAEKYLIHTSHIQCSECKQISEVTKELKNYLRKERGLSQID